MGRMELKWHVKWDPLIIKVSFKCKFACAEAHSISLILKFGLHEMTTKDFTFFEPSKIVQCSAHITQPNTPRDSVCMEASTVTSPTVGLHFWMYIRWYVILWMVLSLSRLPCLSRSLRCHECEHRSTSALLQWVDCPVHPPGDNSRC